MAKRKSLTKKTRFEVFKRDSFTCQYCGATSPDTLLVVDHILPVAEGGTNDLVNLITSCDPCNSGKGARVLSDNSALAKQRSQLESLQARREQLDMMLQWQRSLVAMDDDATEQLARLWTDLAPGYVLNDKGKRELASVIRKCGVEDTVTAMREAADKIEIGAEGKATEESWDEAWSLAKRIAKLNRDEREKPGTKRLAYIFGIVRNRCGYWNGSKAGECQRVLREAYELGVSLDELESIAKHAGSFNGWLDDVGEAMDRIMGGDAR